MTIKRTILAACAVAGLALVRVGAAEVEEGFVTIFDGQTLNGWKKANEQITKAVTEMDKEIQQTAASVHVCPSVSFWRAASTSA